MSTSVPVPQGGMVVVTQIYPSTPRDGVVSNKVSQQMGTGTGTFSRAHPIALGTIQIIIGLMVFSFGVTAAIEARSLAVYSGFFVWGAGLYITAGSLTVAAGKSSNSCLMSTTLAFNVIATVAAGSATILYGIDAAVIHVCRDRHHHRFVWSYDSYDCYKYKGVGVALAVFNFLEFIVTIVISTFACKTTCNCCKKQPSVYIVPGNASMNPQDQPSYSAPASVVPLPLQALPTYPAASTSMANPSSTEFSWTD